VYASNLGGGGIQVYRSTDGGTTWTYLGDLVPDDHSSDRQWVATADEGHVITPWMGGGNGTDRAVAVRTTFDAGDSWTNLTYIGENIGWLGTVQFAPDGEHAYIPFTQRLPDDEKHAFDYGKFALHVARTDDGGETWETVDTGARVTTSDTGTHWSGVLMAPSLHVTGDGSLAYVYSEEVTDPTGTRAPITRVNIVASPEGGDTWNEPTTISTTEQATMPWIAGGGGDRAMGTWFTSPVAGDSDYVGQWNVQAASLDGIGTGEPDVERTTIAENVHTGRICARGGFCLFTGSDRALLDDFENDVTRDGRLVVTYPADPATDARQNQHQRRHPGRRQPPADPVAHAADPATAHPKRTSRSRATCISDDPCARRERSSSSWSWPWRAWPVASGTTGATPRAPPTRTNRPTSRRSSRPSPRRTSRTCCPSTTPITRTPPATPKASASRSRATPTSPISTRKPSKPAGPRSTSKATSPRSPPTKTARARCW
jgi:hypothetical protein